MGMLSWLFKGDKKEEPSKAQGDFVELPQKEVVIIEKRSELPMPKQKPQPKQEEQRPVKKMYKCYKCNYSFKRRDDFPFTKCPYCGNPV